MSRCVRTESSFRRLRVKQRVEFIRHESRIARELQPDSYHFRPRGRLSAAQRAAWWFLQRTGALENSFLERVTFTKHVVDPPKFIERVFAQKKDLLENFDREGQRLLVGSEDYSQIMDEAEPGWFTFDAEVGFGRRILGLKVEVIPWMRGIVLMP